MSQNPERKTVWEKIEKKKLAGVILMAFSLSSLKTPVVALAALGGALFALKS